MKRSHLLIGLIMVLTLTLPQLFAAEDGEPARRVESKKAVAPEAKKISTDRLPGESPLVRAARLARESRADGKKSTISITDEDVRASTGRITVGQYAGPDPETSRKKESAGEIFEKMEKDRERSAREAKEAAERVAELEREVAGLERASALLEDEYYEHSDATDREDEIMTAFESTRTNLDTKRDELAAARELLNQKRLESSNIVKP